MVQIHYRKPFFAGLLIALRIIVSSRLASFLGIFMSDDGRGSYFKSLHKKNARLIRENFPITPEVQIRQTEKPGQCLLSIIAADRPGLLFTVASTLDAHDINVHTAKIATLGERVEDTFLVSGAELAKTATLLRLESELLERLQV